MVGPNFSDRVKGERSFSTSTSMLHGRLSTRSLPNAHGTARHGLDQVVPFDSVA